MASMSCASPCAGPSALRHEYAARLMLSAPAPIATRYREQDMLSSRDDRLQSAAAQAVHGEAGGRRQPALDRRAPRCTCLRLAVDHAAEHDVTDRRRVDFRPRHRFPDCDRPSFVGGMSLSGGTGSRLSRCERRRYTTSRCAMKPPISCGDTRAAGPLATDRGRRTAYLHLRPIARFELRTPSICTTPSFPEHRRPTPCRPPHSFRPPKP